jgi:putative heme-binding domain-containing protein
MLIPVTQPGSDLGYTPELEVVTVVFKSDSAIRLYAPGVKVEQGGAGEARITVTPTGEGRYQPFTATITTPAKSFDVSFHTNRDPRPRALGTRRFLVPFAKAVHSDAKQVAIPEIAGGNWEAGRELFKGKALCATCHQLRGDGVQVGPDLGNLVHRDYASVLIDIADPSAAINPDAAGYGVTLHNGSAVIGARLSETPEELQIAQPGGAVARLKKSDIARTDPMTASLMPPGLDKLLTATELRDLMTYLLTERASASDGEKAE